MDFLNKSYPVVQPDANGNYPWMIIKAGATGSSFQDLSLHGNLNMNGNSIINASIGRKSFYSYEGESSGTVTLTSGAPLPQILNIVPSVTVKNQSSTGFTVSNSGILTNNTGSNAQIKVTLTCVLSTSDPVTVDSVVFLNNGVTAAERSGSSLVGLQIKSNQKITITFDDLVTNLANGNSLGFSIQNSNALGIDVDINVLSMSIYIEEISF